MRIRCTLGACAILPLLAGPVCADGDANQGWRDDFTARLEATALLQALNAELLSHDSATLTLDRWCESHHLASPPKIVTEQIHGTEKTPTAEQRQDLRVDNSEPIRYRRVRLRCGDHTLSEADNWYVPSRLTPEMNHQLETTNIAFGRAVQALRFRRRTLSAKLLWSPLPDGWESSAALPGESTGALQIPFEVIEHRAILLLPDGTPFSEVVETYTRDVLAFPEPQRR
jgi:chorismate-pyruvate lyase